LRQHLRIDMAPCLAINARRPTAGVLTHAFSGDAQQVPVADDPEELSEPFGGLGSRKFTEMFKFAEWVAHEV
jgi:hypothetical protein